MSATPPTLTQRFAGAAAWNTMLFPVQFVVGLVASVLMLRYLTLAQYGVLTLLTGLAATIGLVADLGIERSLPRFIPEVERCAGRAGVSRFLVRVILLKMSIAVVAIILLMGLSDALLHYVITKEERTLQQNNAQIALLQTQGAPQSEIDALQARRDSRLDVINLIEQNGRTFLAAVAALVFLGALYDVFMQFLTAYFKQRSWNVITAIVALTQPLLIASFVLLDWGLSGVLLGMVLTPVAAVAMAAWRAIRVANMEVEESPADPAGMPGLPQRVAKFAGISFLTQGTTWCYDVAFVSFALTAMGMSLDQIALVAFSYTFAKSYLSYAYLPFGGLLTPLLTRIRGRNEPAALQEAYHSLSRLFALILIPAGVGLALITPWLLELLYPRYTQTALLVYLFIAFAFGESLLSVPHNVLMVYERYRPVVMARLLALLSIPLIIMLVPAMGLVGAAVAVGVARLLPRIVTMHYVRRDMGLTYPLSFAMRVMTATLAFGAPLLLLLVYWPLPPSSSDLPSKFLAAFSLGGLAGLAAVGYVLALRLLGGLDEQERKRILSLKLPFKRAIARIL